MPYYINAAATIAHQPVFQRRNFVGQMHVLRGDEMLEQVPYKDYIDAGLLRRMSKLLRMGVACGKECLKEEQDNFVVIEAIIVGTGLGCLFDTEKFLDTNLTVSGLLPPTSFIQSTHNTIAGQISLSLGNHSYNMTHTQNTLSFEHALLDGLLWLDQDKNEILVGAADESIDLLTEIASNYWSEPLLLTSGASFFKLSNKKSFSTLAQVLDVSVYTGEGELEQKIATFMQTNRVDLATIHAIYYQPSLGEKAQIFDTKLFGSIPVINTLDFSGIYATASAFAFHMAVDELAMLPSGKKILVCNHLNTSNIGLTLLESIET
jgi:hypothetical protein